MNKDCTVIINTCDAYEEAWEPFFFLFNRYWKDCPFEVCINTETKKYDKNGERTVNATGSWTKRLERVLEQIDTPFVLCCLEDFYLQYDVRTDKIMKCLDVMKAEDSIGCIYFKRLYGYENDSIEYEEYQEVKPRQNDKNEYIFSCQVAIWRRDVLVKALSRFVNGTAWDFEVNGYEYNRDILNEYRFYSTRKSHWNELFEDEIFPYNAGRDIGTGIYKSRWLWNNKKFFKQRGYILKYKSIKKMSRIEFWYIEYGIPYIRRIRAAIERRNSFH